MPRCSNWRWGSPPGWRALASGTRKTARDSDDTGKSRAASMRPDAHASVERGNGTHPATGTEGISSLQAPSARYRGKTVVEAGGNGTDLPGRLSRARPLLALTEVIAFRTRYRRRTSRKPCDLNVFRGIIAIGVSPCQRNRSPPRPACQRSRPLRFGTLRRTILLLGTQGCSQ